MSTEAKTVEEQGAPGGGRSAAVIRVPVPDLCCLWAETDATPMNIALVGTLAAGRLVNEDGEVSLPRIRAAVAAHLDQTPMLRRALRHTRLGQGRAVWVDAEQFAIDQHVVLIADNLRTRVATLRANGSIQAPDSRAGLVCDPTVGRRPSWAP
jgi:hypothetical protein